MYNGMFNGMGSFQKIKGIFMRTLVGSVDGNQLVKAGWWTWYSFSPPRLSISLRLDDWDYTVNTTGQIMVSLDGCCMGCSTGRSTGCTMGCPMEWSVGWGFTKASISRELDRKFNWNFDRKFKRALWWEIKFVDNLYQKFNRKINKNFDGKGKMLRRETKLRNGTKKRGRDGGNRQREGI